MSHLGLYTPYPKVDAVIATLNCRELLKQCLTRLKSQSYPGPVRIIVVDGGSEDGTTSLAEEMGCEVHVQPGQYGTGLTGARNQSLQYCEGDLYWQIDADNFVQDETTLWRLVEPFMSVEGLQLSVPMIGILDSQAGIDKYLARAEAIKIESMARQGAVVGHWAILEDTFYGITNATLLRTDLLRRVGGYDSDMRVLRRARHLRLSKGVIVDNAIYYHLSAQSLLKWIEKQSRRIQRIGRMTPAEIDHYFAPSSHDHAYRRTSLGDIPAIARLSRELRKEGVDYWFWGWFLLLGYSLVLLRHPWSFVRTFFRFL